MYILSSMFPLEEPREEHKFGQFKTFKPKKKYIFATSHANGLSCRDCIFSFMNYLIEMPHLFFFIVEKNIVHEAKKVNLLTRLYRIRKIIKNRCDYTYGLPPKRKLNLYFPFHTENKKFIMCVLLR